MVNKTILIIKTAYSWCYLHENVLCILLNNLRTFAQITLLFNQMHQPFVVKFYRNTFSA